MDAVQADRLRTSYQQALQTWERAQVLMAEAEALCEAALVAQGRTEELRLQPPALPRS
jgi:hypothetical protein